MAMVFSNGEWIDDGSDNRITSGDNALNNRADPSNVSTQPASQMSNRDQTIARDSSSWEATLRQLGGDLYDPTDLAGVQRQVSYAQNAETDPAKWIQQQAAIYDQRRAQHEDRTTDSQSDIGNTLYGSGSGNASNTPGGKLTGGYSYNGASTPNRSGGTVASAARPSMTLGNQFSDPISSYLQSFSQQRSSDLQNPPSGSGQSLYEQALQSISSQFANGGFTPGQQETLNSQALEPIEQLRTQRKQQVLQQLAQRNINPQSGVAIQMLADVDKQFDTLMTQQRRSIANQATTEQQNRLLSSLQMLQSLAGTQNQRQDQAYQYATVPYQLAQTAFSNASGLSNQSNPLALIQPLLALSSQQSGQQQNQSEALGMLAYLLQNGLTG